MYLRRFKRSFGHHMPIQSDFGQNQRLCDKSYDPHIPIEETVCLVALTLRTWRNFYHLFSLLLCSYNPSSLFILPHFLAKSLQIFTEISSSSLCDFNLDVFLEFYSVFHQISSVSFLKTQFQVFPFSLFCGACSQIVPSIWLVLCCLNVVDGFSFDFMYKFFTTHVKWKLLRNWKWLTIMHAHISSFFPILAKMSTFIHLSLNYLGFL